MKKRMAIMLAAVGLLFGGVIAYQFFKSQIMKKSMSIGPPPATVSAIKADYQTWQPGLKAVGSFRAVHGVDVTSEIAGLVRTVYFKANDEVKEGQVLVQLNADADIAQLQSLEAAAELANIVYERDEKQFAALAVSQATLDADAADLKSKQAQVAQQVAIVEKKTIRAPFAGRLGISTVNPGQYVNPGDKVVTLQSLDPIYVDFYLPQQELSRIAPAQKVVASTDTYPNRSFNGKVTAVNPKVETDSRNVLVEAIVTNPGHELLPGMYSLVEVNTGSVQRYLTVPQTAVTFNPYGETVFIVQGNGKSQDGTPLLIARQIFVTVGPTRGDQIAILTGIKQGDTVVTSGQLKLKNGSAVIINNQVQPSNDASPKPADK